MFGVSCVIIEHLDGSLTRVLILSQLPSPGLLLDPSITRQPAVSKTYNFTFTSSPLISFAADHFAAVNTKIMGNQVPRVILFHLSPSSEQSSQSWPVAKIILIQSLTNGLQSHRASNHR